MQERTRYLRRPRRTRWQRWVESIDLWHPRPIDYVLIAGGFLVLSLLWIGERTFAVHLSRRVIQLEERRAGLDESGAALAVRVNALADRSRITTHAERDLGMVVPRPQAFQIIAYVPARGVAGHLGREGRSAERAGFGAGGLALRR